jgi:thimet oligopeptidase
MFEIRRGKRLADGGYLKPAAALMCNFPKPGDGPALMNHSDVTTFFHEFGHVLHHVLTQQPLASYAGTSTARDFVEAPSQMFEEWAYRRDTLDLFAKHHKTGEKIPEKLFGALLKSRSFGRALGTERQISLATLDFEYHSKSWPFSTDEVFGQVMAKTQSFSYLPGTHFQATFGHLMEYDAGYYGYQWALAIARDVLTRFDKEGFMNASVAGAWRKAVLEQGAGEDENKLVETFLGRPHDLKAYVAYLKGK